MDPNEMQRRRALADATRRLIRAARLTLVDGEVMAETTERVQQAAAALEAELSPGPHSQVDVDPATAINPTVPPGEFFPFSPVIGPLNPISAPLEVEVVDLAELDIDGPAVSATGCGIRGTVVLGEQYVGPPWNLAHGGIIANLLDELLGLATIMGAGGGFTGRLTIHYHRPTPALRPLELVAWVESVSGRKIIAKGEIRHDGTVTAAADGLFIRSRQQVEGERPTLSDTE